MDAGLGRIGRELWTRVRFPMGTFSPHRRSAALQAGSVVETEGWMTLRSAGGLRGRERTCGRQACAGDLRRLRSRGREQAEHLTRGETIPLDPAMTVTVVSSGGVVLGEADPPQHAGDENDMSLSVRDQFRNRVMTAA